MTHAQKKKLQHVTLGCKVNQAETEAISAFYSSQPEWLIDGHSDHADLCIINTCAVTQKAAMQSRQAVRKAVRRHPKALIVVTGCYAQSDPGAFADISGVDIIVGQAHKHRIPELISKRLHPENNGKDRNGLPEVHVAPLKRGEKFHPMPAPAFGYRTRPFLKIQDGCDAFCTYCIVPHTRGASRSLEPDLVLSEISALLSKNTPEIVLSGIHIGRYGHDLNPKSSLLELLQNLENLEGAHRIRLSSIEPTELTDDLLDFIQSSKRICRHFHIPLQSGDPRILERMHRPYAPETFSSLIEKIRLRFPQAAIGADVLIGFPGEDNRAFVRTYDLIDSLPVTYLHVFPYSRRPLTPAASFSDQVPTGVVKERCRQMQELGVRKRNRFYRAMIGKPLDVVIEERVDSQAGVYRGISANYIPVFLPGAESLKGRRATCLATNMYSGRGVAGLLIPDCHHGEALCLPANNCR